MLVCDLCAAGFTSWLLARYKSSGAGGYIIDGVTRFLNVLPRLDKLHPKVVENPDKPYDWHFDTKAYDDAWIAVKLAHQVIKGSSKKEQIDWEDILKVKAENKPQ